MQDRNRIITPYNEPSRFTREEKAAFDAGKCCWDIGDSHWGQRDTMCHQPSQPGAPFGYCVVYAHRLLEDHWPDGSPRR